MICFAYIYNGLSGCIWSIQSISRLFPKLSIHCFFHPMGCSTCRKLFRLNTDLYSFPDTMVPVIPFWGILTTILCFQCAGGISFFSQALLPSSATVSFKWWMSHIISITARTFLTAALLFLIFSIAACISDISIGVILMISWLSSHISLEIVLRWN